MSKSAAREFLKEQLATAETEQKRLQAAVARLPLLEAEIQACKLLLEKLSGGMRIEPPSRSTHTAPSFSAQGDSISSLVQRALTEANKPQTTAQLLAFLASHGKRTTSATLRSTIYMKKGKLFNVISPGLYGLIGWERTEARS